MLYLRTGLPGAGKTLNAIREIDLEHQPDPENPLLRLHRDPDAPDLPPRTIYYYGIPDVKLDRLKSRWVEFHTPEQWFDLPDGSVIVIDEAQRVFGNEGTRARPEKITRFETHRHQGLDIHLITQHPSLLAPAVRKLVGKHINFIRPYGRNKGIFRHEYEFCIDNPEKRSYFKQAQEEKVKLDPAYFGTYKSSTIHTHKPTTPGYMKMIPLYAAGFILPLAFIGGLLWWFISGVEDEKEALRAQESDQQAPEISPGKPLSASVARSDSHKSTDEYIEDRTPRITTLPASAPRYDELTKPRDFPRLHCTYSTDERVVERFRKVGQVASIDGKDTACQCYSQQGTRIATDVAFCVDVVTNGIFDDTRLQPSIASGRNPNGIVTESRPDPAAAMQRGRAAASPPQSPSTLPSGSTGAEYVPRVTVVADSEYPARPWR